MPKYLTWIPAVHPLEVITNVQVFALGADETPPTGTTDLGVVLVEKTALNRLPVPELAAICAAIGAEGVVETSTRSTMVHAVLVKLDPDAAAAMKTAKAKSATRKVAKAKAADPSTPAKGETTVAKSAKKTSKKSAKKSPAKKAAKKVAKKAPAKKAAKPIVKKRATKKA